MNALWTFEGGRVVAYNQRRGERSRTDLWES
jgi:hypothetical protein